MDRICFAITILLPNLALADDIDVELESKALEGQTRPALILKINKPVSSIVLDLNREDGKHVRRTSGAVKAGTSKRFELDTPVGTWGFKGTLEVKFRNGSGGKMPLEFSVETAGPFVIRTSHDHLDLEKGEVQIQLTRTAGRCEHEVTIEGKPERIGMTKLNGEPAGTWLTLAWRKYSDDDLVLRIRMQCWDPEDAFHTDPHELFPWKLEIPHEDVNFETGKWDIRGGEEPKLERAYEEIAKAVSRYGKIVAVKLYVAGHTDTVGPKSSNRTLSLNRARSIAGWFGKRGVRAQIWYAGFGEDDLLYDTPDQTDDARNRRAEYIIGVEKPLEANWKRL